jgi:hypothetical protein
VLRRANTGDDAALRQEVSSLVATLGRALQSAADKEANVSRERFDRFSGDAVIARDSLKTVLLSQQESMRAEAAENRRAHREQIGRRLEASVRNSTKTIREKYVNPPVTTDFAILFLPTEGLYAEALRRPGLAAQIQREQGVLIAGHATLTAILSSLQMGFRRWRPRSVRAKCGGCSKR